MDTRNLVHAFFLVLATAGVVAQGVLARGNADDASVTVVAHGPAGLRIEGRSMVVTSARDAEALTFEVPIAPIDTGIALRNRHLRELLEADRFPAAILRIPRSGLTLPAPGQATHAAVRGELTLRGRARPVEVQYRAEGTDGLGVRVEGSLQVDLGDFDIAAPSYLGMSVSPQVQVDVELTVEPQ